MEFRNLSDNASVGKHVPDSSHHTVDVFTLLHEAEAVLEGDCADDVEGVVLEPIREVDWLVCSGTHFFDEDIGALVYVWFERAD